jgi:hypothetical protein
MSSLAERVAEVVGSALYSDEAVRDLPPNTPPSDAIIVEGIVNSFAFDPKRLEATRATVIQLISEIVADQFYKDVDGGWSFLNLCVDRTDEQWCEHRIADDFVCICIALGLAGFCAPRYFWRFLPGGMPYIWFERPSASLMAQA